MTVRGPLTRVGAGHSQRQDSRSGSSGRANELGRANLRSAGPVTLTEPGQRSARRIARGTGASISAWSQKRGIPLVLDGEVPLARGQSPWAGGLECVQGCGKPRGGPLVEALAEARHGEGQHDRQEGEQFGSSGRMSVSAAPRSTMPRMISTKCVSGSTWAIHCAACRHALEREHEARQQDRRQQGQERHLHRLELGLRQRRDQQAERERGRDEDAARRGRGRRAGPRPARRTASTPSAGSASSGPGRSRRTAGSCPPSARPARPAS